MCHGASNQLREGTESWRQGTASVRNVWAFKCLFVVFATVCCGGSFSFMDLGVKDKELQGAKQEL